MSIRNHESAQSQTFRLEKEWFSKGDSNETDIGRFSYMPKGTRDAAWNFKVDLSDSSIILNDTTFLIEQQLHINRPDSISHKVYGNSKYWWIIALRNNINDPFYEFYKGKELKIPDLILTKKLLGF